jgi:hypothetical protein
VSDEPKPKEYVIEKYFDDSPVGPGKAIARLFVTPGEPVVDLVLRWQPENTENQPDTWEITWVHHPDMIWEHGGQLERYLQQLSGSGAGLSSSAGDARTDDVASSTRRAEQPDRRPSIDEKAWLQVRAWRSRVLSRLSDVNLTLELKDHVFNNETNLGSVMVDCATSRIA